MFDPFIFPYPYANAHTDFIIHTNVTDLHINLSYNVVYVQSPGAPSIFYKRDLAPDRLQYYLTHAKRIKCITPSGAQFIAARIAGQHAIAYALACMNLLPELRALVSRYIICNALGDRT